MILLIADDEKTIRNGLLSLPWADIGIEEVYQAENDVKEFRASLEAVKFYSHSYRHFMGANLHNVI